MDVRFDRTPGRGVWARGLAVGACLAAVGVVACSDVPERTRSSNGSLVAGANAGTCPKAVGDTFKRTPWVQPAPIRQAKCTDVQAEGIIQCYLNKQAEASPQCQSFVNDPQNAGCITCALSRPTDPVRGPIVYDTERGTGAYNFPGCVAGLTNDPSPTGCGAAYATATQCAIAACECASDAFFVECMASAQSSVCAPYQAAATCAAQAAPACEGIGQAHWFGPGFFQRGYELIRLFCGQ